ncbi:hypothetical protein GCM10009839_83030 [Catenulispora yoronensis]|uniref:Uncharacterized protein n=1 Tax=Catenulispora yoronensis TaxID=450799 RepID=A0ABP5H4G9_9ACTN
MIEAPKVEDEIGIEVSPFQYTVQEPLVAAWMNAIVRYFAPDAALSVAGSSPLYASKYGAKMCAGVGVAAGVAAWPAVADAMKAPALAAIVAAAVASARR